MSIKVKTGSRPHTNPNPGLLDFFSKCEGNNPTIGIRESSSFQSTFKAGSQNDLQVRANLDTERLPPGISLMASMSFWVTSESRRIEGNIVCW